MPGRLGHPPSARGQAWASGMSGAPPSRLVKEVHMWKAGLLGSRGVLRPGCDPGGEELP